MKFGNLCYQLYSVFYYSLCNIYYRFYSRIINFCSDLIEISPFVVSHAAYYSDSVEDITHLHFRTLHLIGVSVYSFCDIHLDRNS